MSQLRVVFDLDDTLYPERSFAISAFGAASRWAKATLGVDGLEADMTRLLDAGHLGQLFPMVLEQRGIDRVHAAGLLDAYRTHAPAHLALYSDAAEVLHLLAALGPMGLITDGTVSVQQAKVRALGLARTFQEIIYTHGLGGREFAKPHPSAFEAMQASIGKAGDRFVYVGDNPAKDFVSPNQMGWQTVQIERPQRIHANAETAAGGKAQHVITTLADLPGILGI